MPTIRDAEWFAEAIKRQKHAVAVLTDDQQLCRQCGGTGLESMRRLSDCQRCTGTGLVRK